MKKKDKNVSKKIPNGLIIHTKDQSFYGQGNFRKKGYKNKGNYRKAVVVDTNRNDDMAVVKLTTSPKGIEVTSVEKSKYKAYIETIDDKGNPIRISGHFIPGNKMLSRKDVSDIKKECLRNSKTSVDNKRKLRNLKGRK